MRPETSSLGPCPDDEVLAALVEDRLAETERARVERHVARCAGCIDVVAAAGETSAAATGAAPAASAPLVPGGREKSGWRRLAVAAVIVIVGGLAVGMLAKGLGTHLVGSQVAMLGSRLLGVPLRVGGASVRPAGLGQVVLTLRELSLGHAGAFAVKADAFAVTIALAAPLTGDSPITSVRVTRPEVDLAAYGSAALLGSRAARARVLAALGADRIEIEGGRIVVPGAHGQPLVISDVTGGAVREADALRVALQGRTAEGTVDVTGDAGLDGESLVFTVGGRDLQAAAIPPFGEGMRGTMDLRLDVHARGDTARAAGRVAVRDGALLGHEPAALLGLDATAGGVLRAFDPGLGGRELAFDEARAALAWRDGTWRLPRVFVTGHGIVAGGRARIAADRTVSGHGTVRLPAALVDGLRPHAPVLDGFREATGDVTLPFGVAGDLATPSISLGP